MKTIFHATTGALTFLMLSLFMIGSLASLIFYPHEVFIESKSLILQSFWSFIPALCITAAIGLSLSRGRSDPLIQVKRMRMLWITGISLLILLPTAYYLHLSASTGEIDLYFYLIQGVEILFDLTVLLLLGLNFRDGSKLIAQRM